MPQTSLEDRSNCLADRTLDSYWSFFYSLRRALDILQNVC